MPEDASRKNLIERIRQQPEPTRWAITIAVTAVLAGLLIVFWVQNISRQLAALSTSSSIEKEKSAAGEVSPAPASFSAAIRGVVDSLKVIGSGADPVKTAEEPQPSPAAREKPPLEEPSALGSFFRTAADIVRFNLALMGKTFRDVSQGNF
ncbi:MAG: hypothetical protein HYT40_01440 [Candidatus Sungbacteria bacterium]|uniref:Uncharacterized protein n=1 Tax=Candidatus Sungiibacteriota bacterium TaxID=2750080 RepID=A0A931SB77_9BACT|nr:hypothetical protein [Candidatus Sungbacteria bacterium]